MSAAVLRSRLRSLTASQLRFKMDQTIKLTSFRSFSGSSPQYSQSDEGDSKPRPSILERILDTEDSNISRRTREIAAKAPTSSLKRTGVVSLELETHKNRVFEENYRRLESGNGILLDAAARREILRRLIRLAAASPEWDKLKRAFAIWKENQWGMEAVAETAIYTQAVEHLQIPILVYLIQEGIVHPPTPRQVRQVAHAIHRMALPLEDRLVLFLNFNHVNMDPQILSKRRPHGTTSKSRSTAATDDMVFGMIMLSWLLQAAGETSFAVPVQRLVAKLALELSSALRRWIERGLDGSGGSAISLAQDEKGWAYVATLDCSTVLELSSVAQTLKSVWLESPEATWAPRRGLGTRLNKDWDTHFDEIKEWVKEAIRIFEEK